MLSIYRDFLGFGSGFLLKIGSRAAHNVASHHDNRPCRFSTRPPRKEDSHGFPLDHHRRHPRHYQLGDVASARHRGPFEESGRGVRLADVQRGSAAGEATEGCLPRLAARRRAGRADRGECRRHHRERVEGLGGRARRHALHPLVPATHRHHRGEARLLPGALGGRPRRRRVQRQGVDQG